MIFQCASCKKEVFQFEIVSCNGELNMRAQQGIAGVFESTISEQINYYLYLNIVLCS